MLEPIRRVLRDKLLNTVEEVAQRHRRHLDELARHQHASVIELLERQHREQLDAFRREADRVVEVVRNVEQRSRRDLNAGADREAVASTVRFLDEAMPSVPTRPSPQATLEYALSLAPDDGMALEFGVFSGQTLKVIAEARDGNEVYGFDSFEGLPEDWRSGFPTGAFRVETLPDVSGAELVVGWFDDTLPDFLAEHPGPVTFLHVDGDLYSSAKTVLDQVGPRLRPGSVIAFDEFFNYPGWQRHEYRAWHEYVERTGLEFEYLAYTRCNEQVAVRIVAFPGQGAGVS